MKKKKIICIFLLLLLLLGGCEQPSHRCPYNNDQYYHVCLKLLTSGYRGASKYYYGVIPIEDYEKWKNEEESILHIYYICSHAESVGINEEKIINTLISMITVYNTDDLPWGYFE